MSKDAERRWRKRWQTVRLARRLENRLCFGGGLDGETRRQVVLLRNLIDDVLPDAAYAEWASTKDDLANDAHNRQCIHNSRSWQEWLVIWIPTLRQLRRDGVLWVRGYREWLAQRPEEPND